MENNYMFENVEKTIKRIRENDDPRYADIILYDPQVVLKELFDLKKLRSKN